MTTFNDWLDEWEKSLTPAQRRNHDRRMKVTDKVYKCYSWFPWMQWPILQVIYCFWHSMFEEGFKATCKPRWGTLTFAYLNDGIKPTLWHTLRQITHNPLDKYAGFYPDGAPKSLKQAQEWDAKWEKERIDKIMDPIRETEGWDW
jgi:hypothetical protein